MNNNQREIISDLFRVVLNNGRAGDMVNCYNDSIRAIQELGKTDTKLMEMLDTLESLFENS